MQLEKRNTKECSSHNPKHRLQPWWSSFDGQSSWLVFLCSLERVLFHSNVRHIQQNSVVSEPMCCPAKFLNRVTVSASHCSLVGLQNLRRERKTVMTGELGRVSDRWVTCTLPVSNAHIYLQRAPNLPIYLSRVWKESFHFWCVRKCGRTIPSIVNTYEGNTILGSFAYCT